MKINNDKIFNSICLNSNLLTVLLNLMESQHREHCNYIAERLSDSILEFVENEIGKKADENQKRILMNVIADKLPDVVEDLYHILI